MAVKKEADCLREERATLLKNTEELKALIESDEFKKFNLMKQGNLKVQLEAMTIYMNILKIRLKEVE